MQRRNRSFLCGDAFKSFPPLNEVIPRELRDRSAVLDGEIVCRDRGTTLHYSLSMPVPCATVEIATEFCERRLNVTPVTYPGAEYAQYSCTIQLWEARMYVPFSYVRCPSCGSTFEAGASIAPPDNAVGKTCSQTDRGDQSAAMFTPASVLHSWKEIAAYVRCGVRTVERWEHDFGLPVHRIGARERTAVIAFPQEIDRWLHSTPVGLQRYDAGPARV